MNKKLSAVASVIAILIVGSFYVGVLWSPYGSLNGIGFESSPAAMYASGDQAAYVRAVETQGPDQDRVVIYSAQISLETSDIQGVLDRIRSLGEGYGGYVAGTSRSTYGAQAVAEISIRVPEEKFQIAVREIETYGKILDEHTTSEDVTQQYIDLNARLNNLQNQEQRLREILRIAQTVDEILRVENELARVRGEIDSLQGQINYLERNAEMSLICVRLIEPAPMFMPPGMDWGETLETAIAGFFAVIRGLIILAFTLTPLALIGVPAYYAYKRKRTKVRQ
jgi:hypothetical protein